jgi:hypothetical protein
LRYNCFDAHFAHQRADVLASDHYALSLEQAHQHARAGKRMLQVQLVDAAHERKIRGTQRARRVVRTGSADADQRDLPGNPQGVGTINHFFALSRPALPSAPAAPNTSAARSCNCRFHSVI